jgi:replication-associated recombination protein RarA
MTLDDICINTQLRNKLDTALASRPHALMLIGDKGFGKASIAALIANRLTKDRQHNKVLIDGAQSITIDQIRELKKFFVLKTNQADIWRVAIVLDADKMTIDAQNSLLKLLEEPPENCMLIMTTSREWDLLPTIHSRVQTLRAISPSTDALTKFFVAKGYKSVDIVNATALCGSLPGAVSDILAGVESSLTANIQLAKQILSSKIVDRLKLVDKLSKDRAAAIELVSTIKTIAAKACSASVASAKPTDKWQLCLQKCIESAKYLESNANAKLVLTNLVISF